MTENTNIINVTDPSEIEFPEEAPNTGIKDPEFMYFHAPTLAFYQPEDEKPEGCVEVPMIEVRAIFNKLDGLTELCVDDDGYPTVRQTTSITEDQIRQRLQQTLTNHYELQLKQLIIIEGVAIPCTTEEMNKFVSFLAAAQFTMEESMEYQSQGEWKTLSIEQIKKIVPAIRKWQNAYMQEYKRLQKDIDTFITNCHGIFRLMYDYKYDPQWPSSIE